MKKRSIKKRRNFKKPPASESLNLSLTWLTEEQVYEKYSTTKDCLRKWRGIGLPTAQPSGRVYINQTDMQNFLISFRKIEVKS